MRRLTGLCVAAAIVLSGCIGTGSANTYTATFSRAVQIFPASSVRVLGVNVGTITDVKNVSDGVQVQFTVSKDTKLPAGVQAAVVPASLLGERYIQLFPAYQGGPTLPAGSTIPESRTAVPAEPDEVLRSLQDYMGRLDPHTVTKFVENAARILQGNGLALNSLIHHGAGVISELAAKRADLAQIIVEFQKVSSALSTRQQSIASLIRSYNAVAGTLVRNRTALGGSITGLRDASLQLAQLLISHRTPLHSDVRNITATAQTLSKNVHQFADTGHWASRLFHAAQRAVDYNKNWLRLNNQGQALGGMIMQRLEQRLMEFCDQLGLPFCTMRSYWAQHVPSLFCFKALSKCAPHVHANPEKQLTQTITQTPKLVNALLKRFQQITCADAKYPKQCLRRKAILVRCAKTDHPKACLEKNALLLQCLKTADVQQCLEANKNSDVKKIVSGLLQSTVGNTNLTSGLTGGTP